jgi:hypothetical protein
MNRVENSIFKVEKDAISYRDKVNRISKKWFYYVESTENDQFIMKRIHRVDLNVLMYPNLIMSRDEFLEKFKSNFPPT